MAKILVTGAAGFIGFHLSQCLLDEGHDIVGLDNLNTYYDVGLKQARLTKLEGQKGFRFAKMDLMERDGLAKLFVSERFEVVVNLAAQAGIRYSIQNPHAYIDSNITGFMNILEECRHNHIKHLVFASSSSVYGANTLMPFSVNQNVDHPLSPYAATKKANELMAHTYAALYDLPCTGLRFFSVYGPWGRPDMAYFLFTKAILRGEPIDVSNSGCMKRDFTYVADVVEGIKLVIGHIPEPNKRWNGDRPDPGSSFAPYKIYNIGNNHPVDLLQLIEAIENAAGKKAEKRFVPMQPGELAVTFADVEDLVIDVGFKPATPIEAGIKKFVEWYREFYKV